MILYTDAIKEEKDELRRIDEDELQELGINLKKYVNFYKKNFYIDTEECRQHIMNLEYIADSILSRHYENLVDLSAVIFETKSDYIIQL